MSGAAALRACFTLLIIITIDFFATSATSSDTISANESLAGDQTLVSANEVFELGFFTPDSTNYYVGIWYKNIPDRTYVWVANRDTPVTNSSSSVFKIGDKGDNVVILDQEAATGTVLWSSNQTKANSSPVNPVAQLLDNGNLVVREEGDESSSSGFLWQSFDFPTDTLLPDMKLGWDLSQGLDRFLNSWKSPQDPSPGDFSFKLDFHGYPEAFLWDQGKKLYRSGPWNGIRFSGVPEMKSTSDIDFTFVSDQQQVYYSYEVNNPNMISRLTVNSTGTLQRFTWVEDSKSWSMFWDAPKDQCDDFGECGPYGICDTNGSPVCNCTSGFSPKNPQAWYLREGSDGCVRERELDCSSDGFLPLKGLKLPESSNAFVDMEMSLEDCQKGCASNCSCTGYSSANISNGEAGCVMWFGDLLDMRHYLDGGQDFYVKLSASDIVAYGGLVAQNSSTNGLGTLAIVGIAGGGGGVLLLALAAFLMWKRKTMPIRRGRNTEPKGARERSQDFLLNEVVVSSKREYSGENKPEDIELPLFDFNAIASATKNFCDENKLGQGGFGCVYKCRIEEGPVVAVKRLSKNSGQGIEEFKNEVRLIARLQHRNLVRLVGCCVEMDEKILIYEYMEHKSLDSVLFRSSPAKSVQVKRRAPC
ncbi:receptor-like serine/threonine-protein kinase SD1-8 isoform X2 [Rhodamnia argentea]|uniref:non-specific serine/threonine protein kinase n=1 Tax=Rhodamnia argentea TaxID=178133 RepID=A0ABM3HX10_9MYRT|nr:receptor-like serine/threonine-protein kinase SD1-8 isoform X2 [Rhodamnia argentea]